MQAGLVETTLGPKTRNKTQALLWRQKAPSLQLAMRGIVALYVCKAERPGEGTC